MNVNVIMPFGRTARFGTYYRMLTDQGVNRWTLLSKIDEPAVGALPHWVKQVFYEVPAGEDVGCVLINQHVQRAKFNSDERYCFLMDDDWLTPGFIETISGETAPLVVVSMDRGERQPKGALHPCWPLIARRENLHYGHVGFEQGLFRGDVLTKLGGMMTALGVTNQPNEDMLISAALQYETVFRPDLGVLFNWFEGDRWDKPEGWEA